MRRLLPARRFVAPGEHLLDLAHRHFELDARGLGDPDDDEDTVGVEDKRIRLGRLRRRLWRLRER
jgi:hypothetical protein